MTCRHAVLPVARLANDVVPSLQLEATIHSNTGTMETDMRLAATTYVHHRPHGVCPLMTCRLYNNPVLSDVKLKQTTFDGKTREYFAQNPTLCGQSKYFLKAFTGSFAVIIGIGATQGDVADCHRKRLPMRWNSSMMTRMRFEYALKFMYMHEYESWEDKDDEQKEKENAKYEHVRPAMQVYTVADRYDIPRLASSVIHELKSDVTSQGNISVWESVITAHYTAHPERKHPIGALLTNIFLE
jgi:hypothetical protein